MDFDCVRNIELIGKRYGHLFDEIVVATHETESASDRARLEFLGLRVVLVPERELYQSAPSADNRLRQYASALAGIRALRWKDSFVIKVRSDQAFDLAQFIEDYFSYSSSFQDFRQFGLRGPIQGLFFFPSRPFSLCDYALMGPQEALEEFYDAQFAFPSVSFQLAQDFLEGDSIRKFLFRFKPNMPAFPAEALILRLPKDLKDMSLRWGFVAIPDRFLFPWRLAVTGIFSVSSSPVADSLEIRGAIARARFSTEVAYREEWLQLRAGFRPLSHARGRDPGATKIPKIWLLFIPEIRATTRVGFGRKWVSDLYFINKKLFVKLKGHVFALAHRRQS